MSSKCKTDPRAPHGFLRGASHSEGRYVCECEYWEPTEEEEDIDMTEEELGIDHWELESK